MSVTVASFRKDYSATFGSAITYPNEDVTYWLAVASLMMGVTPAFYADALTNAITSAGSDTLHFASLPSGITNGLAVTDFTNTYAIPVGTNIKAVTSTTIVLTANVVDTGVGSGDQIGISGGASSSQRWGAGSVFPTSPPTTIVDIATELFVAHNLVLEKQSADATKRGAVPGLSKGPIASYGVGGVNVSYATANALELDAGHWNLTTWGTRFIKLARFYGSGPVQISVGVAPPFSGGALEGPYPWPAPSDTGFG